MALLLQSRDEQKTWSEWAIKLQRYHLVDPQTGQILNKRAVFDKYYKKSPDTLILISTRIDESGITCSPDYMLKERRGVQFDVNEDAVLLERITDQITRHASKFMSRSKIKFEDGRATIDFDTLKRELIKFGKKIYHNHYQIGDAVEKSFHRDE